MPESKADPTVFTVPAGVLTEHHLFFGVAANRPQPWAEGMAIESVDRDGRDLVVVDFGGGIVRKYAINRLVYARKAAR